MRPANIAPLATLRTHEYSLAPLARASDTSPARGSKPIYHLAVIRNRSGERNAFDIYASPYRRSGPAHNGYLLSRQSIDDIFKRKHDESETSEWLEHCNDFGGIGGNRASGNGFRTSGH